MSILLDLNKLEDLHNLGVPSNHITILTFLILLNNKDSNDIDKFLKYNPEILTVLTELEHLDLIKIVGTPFINLEKYISIDINSIVLRENAINIVLANSIDIELLAEKLRDIYPKKIRSGGVLIRSNQRDVVLKLKKFLQLYPRYTEDQIIRATTNYINERSRAAFTYTKALEYFILKNNVSQLASEIENLSDEEEIEWDKNVV